LLLTAGKKRQVSSFFQYQRAAGAFEPYATLTLAAAVN
jgi:hypothetical protein